MPLIGGVVVTHGNLANELVSAAETIVGDIRHIQAVSIGWHDDVDIARESIATAIERVNANAGVLLLTDMFGGTPTNIACTFLESSAPIEVVTGVNLPMLIALADQEPDETLEAMAQRVREQGQKSIYLASGVLKPLK
ncbi:MAG: PTS sugar transporter subunit IIA [Acidobacteria bacterium]|nr:PTS sugar transporter subunit IIA [Acidobacteriota bacterium]